MILLDANQSLLFGGISITDWLQAIGAIIAIVGVYLGWQQIRKDNKEKQSQIDVLTNLAKEAKEQTTHLAAQVDEMIKGNKLQTKFVSLFQKYVLSNDKSLETQIGLQLLERKRRNQEIQPEFLMEKQSYGHGIIELTLLNKGFLARQVKVINGLDDNVKASIKTTLLDNVVKNNHCFEIVIYDHSKKIDEVRHIQIKVNYENENAVKYYQIIDGCFSDKLKIHLPEEIIEPIENQQN